MFEGLVTIEVPLSLQRTDLFEFPLAKKDFVVVVHVLVGHHELLELLPVFSGKNVSLSPVQDHVEVRNEDRVTYWPTVEYALHAIFAVWVCALKFECHSCMHAL